MERCELGHNPDLKFVKNPDIDTIIQLIKMVTKKANLGNLRVTHVLTFFT